MEPFELTVAEAAERIASRELSPVTLMMSLLERIQWLEPELKAWVTLEPEAAMEAARESERELGQSGPRGPLHGVPVGLKDIFYTEGVKTTACSEVYANFVPAYDATCVARLKKAGALVLGKAVTTPHAALDPSPTVNPWDPTHTPGGSSSGPSVAVAARMCPAALGSQTVGSTLRPAAYNGIVGLKPTYGRISLHGVLPLAWSLDTVGILVRSVKDAALMLQAMAAYDPNDLTSSGEPVSDHLGGIDDLRAAPSIGIVRDFFYERAEEAVRAHTDDIAQHLARAGARVTEVRLPSSFADHAEAGSMTFEAEAAAVHEAEFGAGPDRYPPLIRGIIERGMQTSGLCYAKAQRVRVQFRREVQETLRNVDVLLTPTTPSAAPRDLGTTGDPAFQRPWTTAGLPTISLPSGLDGSGMPLGIQLVALWFNEASLLAVARWCEESLGVRVAPPVG